MFVVPLEEDPSCVPSFVSSTTVFDACSVLASFGSPTESEASASLIVVSLVMFSDAEASPSDDSSSSSDGRPSLTVS